MNAFGLDFENLQEKCLLNDSYQIAFKRIAFFSLLNYYMIHSG